MTHGPGAGWIPPEFREFLTEPAELADLGSMMRVCDPGSDELRPPTQQEVQDGVRKVNAVRDTRDGSLHYSTGIVFMEVDVELL